MREAKKFGEGSVMSFVRAKDGSILFEDVWRWDGYTYRYDKCILK